MCLYGLIVILRLFAGNKKNYRAPKTRGTTIDLPSRNLSSHRLRRFSRIIYFLNHIRIIRKYKVSYKNLLCPYMKSSYMYLYVSKKPVFICRNPQ